MNEEAWRRGWHSRAVGTGGVGGVAHTRWARDCDAAMSALDPDLYWRLYLGMGLEPLGNSKTATALARVLGAVHRQRGGGDE